MEMLILWIGTIIGSFTMELVSESRVFKDVADEGYKIDIKKLSEITKQLNPDAIKMTWLSFLIPIANIMLVLQRTMVYNQHRHMIADQLRVMDTIIPFTKEEEEKYKKNPTAMNALGITIMSQIEEKKDELSISYTEDGVKSTIYHRLENGNPILIRAEGPISEKSLIEQNAKLKELLATLVEELSSRMTTEEIVSAFSTKKTINLNDYPKRESSLSVEEQKQQLEQLKESIINPNPTKEDSKQKTKIK